MGGNMHNINEINAKGRTAPNSLWKRTLQTNASERELDTLSMVRLGYFDVTMPLRGCDKSVTFPLSQREKQVLFWSACGRSGPDIAKLMNVTPNTIATYKRRILEKLGCHSITEAVALATLYASGAKMRVSSGIGHS